jgi:cobyrinic acid a,c-diamide synthase
MRASVRRAAERGVPIYAECGGLMYLGQSLTDEHGREHPMAGVAPLRSSMANGRLTLGYREVTARVDGPHIEAGQRVRGHEFHYSTLNEQPPTENAAYDIADRSPEGFASGNVWASYVHLHFGADARIAPRLVSVAERAAAD